MINKINSTKQTHKFSIRTRNRTDFVDITQQLVEIIQKIRIQNGICFIYIPHTTAGITINENADPDVVKDIESSLDKIRRLKKMIDEGTDYAGKEITEDNIKKVLTAAGVKSDEARIKALTASLEGVDINKAISTAAAMPAAAPSTPAGGAAPAGEPDKKEEKK